MAQGKQQALIIGNLTRDAEVKELGQKKSRAIVFGVAVNGRDQQAKPTFWDVTCWIGDADVSKFLALLTSGIRVAVVNARMEFEPKKDGAGEFKKLTVNRDDIVPLSFKDKTEQEEEPSRAANPPPVTPGKGEFPF